MIYTANSGNYSIQRNDGLIPFRDDSIFYNPVLNAKRFKVLGHVLFPKENILIWIDGNIIPVIPPEEIIEKYLGDNDLAIFKHPYRNCIYKEANVLLNDGRFKNNANLCQSIRNQIDFYKNDGFPINFGLWECNLIIRKNIESVNNLFNNWWSEIIGWNQQRDQISFPYVLKKHVHNIKFRTITEGNIRESKNFIYLNHY